MRHPADLVTPSRDDPDKSGTGAAGSSVARPDPLLAVAAAPHLFDFFHVMRQVEAHHASKPKLGAARRPVPDT